MFSLFSGIEKLDRGHIDDGNFPVASTDFCRDQNVCRQSNLLSQVPEPRDAALNAVTVQYGFMDVQNDDYEVVCLVY